MRAKKPAKKKVCGRCCVPKKIDKFGICRSRKDGRNLYCKGCILVITNAQRDRKRAMKQANEQALTRAQEKAKRELVELERKPNVLANSKDVLAQVWRAIANGCRTREEIHQDTKLDYDTIGDVLVQLVWEYKTVRIEEREFVLVNSERVAACRVIYQTFSGNARHNFAHVNA